jgi:hypothetical protein
MSMMNSPYRYSAACDGTVFSSTVASGARLGGAFAAVPGPRSSPRSVDYSRCPQNERLILTSSVALTTETTASTHKHSGCIIKKDLPCLLVLGLDDRRHRSGLALVEDLQNPTL